MAVLNLDKFINNAKDRIYRVGIELEGGWTDLPTGTRVDRDGSVHVDPPKTLRVTHMEQWSPQRIEQRIREFRQELRTTLAQAQRLVQQEITQQQGILPNWNVGEITSAPMEMASVGSWILKYHPQVVNVTCGLHVHMSFKDARFYSRLMDTTDYQDTILDYLKRWAEKEGLPKTHPIWPRLEGKNEYCQLVFFPDEQAQSVHKNYDRTHPGHRYTAINYCFEQHKTVECRVLPMMEKPEQSVSAVKTVVGITNAFLASQRKKIEGMVVDIPLDSPQQEVTVIQL